MQFVVTTQDAEFGFSYPAITAMVEAGEGSIVGMRYEEALDAVEAGEIDGFVYFPPDFTPRLVSGQTAQLEVVVGDIPPADEAALRGFAQEIASRFSEGRATVDAVAALGHPEKAAPVMRELLSDRSGPAIGLQVEQVGEIAPFNTSNFVLPGYLTMFVFFTAAMGAEALARERQTHTLERLMANGVRRESLIVGKFLAGAFIGVVQVAVMWTVGALAFNVDLGASPVAVVALSLLMVLASAAFGTLLASFVSNVRTASAAGVLTSLVLAPIGGSWWPLFITPQFMQSAGAVHAPRLGQRRAEPADAVRGRVQRRPAVDGGAAGVRGGVPQPRAVALPAGPGGVGGVVRKTLTVPRGGIVELRKRV